MRLKSYMVNEGMDSNLEIIWETLLKDCKPILKELKKSIGGGSGYLDNLFFRGYDNFNGGKYDFQKKKVRINRKPRDTPLEVHETLDNEFYKRFGWNVRSEGVFTAASVVLTGSYGTSTIFFPIGKYKYVWSPKIKDLFEYIGGEDLEYVEDALRDQVGWDMSREYDSEYSEDEKGYWDDEEWIPEIEFDDFVDQKNQDIIDDFEETVYKAVKTFKANDMKGAIRSLNEVVFRCKEYYLVEYRYLQSLMRKIEYEF